MKTNKMKRRRKNHGAAKWIVTGVCALIAAAALLFFGRTYFGWFLPAAPVEGLQVYFIDVGQGDSQLIRCGDHSVLVDGGEAENGPDLVAFLRSLGIKELDCVVATHPHADHIGGLIDVLEYVPVRELLMPELTEKNLPATRVFERFMEAAAASGAKAVRAVPGNVHAYGDIVFTVLSPVWRETENLNDMSVVFRLVYGGVSFLFTGDAEQNVERALLENGCELRSDVLKVGHHGSTTSSSPEFLAAVSPRYAVVGCGDGTEYHPHKSTLEKLSSVGAKVYRTDAHGTVLISTDGKTISVETGNNE